MHLDTVADAAALMTRMGLYSGDYLAEWLRPILTDLGVSTFADLRITDDPGMSLPEDHQYTLVVHTSDISRGYLVRLRRTRYYGAETGHPGRRRRGAGVHVDPFFFEPVKFASKPATVKVRQRPGHSSTELTPAAR